MGLDVRHLGVVMRHIDFLPELLATLKKAKVSKFQNGKRVLIKHPNNIKVLKKYLFLRIGLDSRCTFYCQIHPLN